MSMYDRPAHDLPSQLSASLGVAGDADMLATEDILNDLLPMEIDPNLSTPNPQDYSALMPPANNQQAQENGRREATAGSNAFGDMTGAGAGPLPTGFGAQAIHSLGGSTLTEFTKRRNWSQRIIEEIKDFMHILTPDGRMLYVSPSARSLTGYEPEELVNKFLVDFIHTDDKSIFLREFDDSIASGNPLRFFYRFRKSDGTYAIFESHGHPHLTTEAASFGPGSNVGRYCRGFFMMDRPYLSKNANLLDSFLEHKIESERLTKRISDLRREELEEAENQRDLNKNTDPRSGLPTSPTGAPTEAETLTASQPSVASIDYNGMPPPAKPVMSNTALTQQNLDEANASSKPDSINDKMARYEGTNHIDSIEMLTGLRYRDGERSKGISTGDTSPALIRGDAGIAMPVDKDNRGGDKKKKLKIADEYVCTDCGTLESPEWRKGPSGPKTLCNACGLRWAKKEKKRTPSLPQISSSVPNVALSTAATIASSQG